jgi:hypothetical protein
MTVKTAILAAVLVAVLSATARAQAIGGSPTPLTIGGAYRVSGTNFNGSKYAGTAQITLTNNSDCRIVWVTGPTTSYGSCMRKGSVFAAGYILGGAVGLVVYDLQPDGSLDGIWTVANQPGAGTETLTPLRR